jgi:uncharacterized membrane protein
MSGRPWAVLTLVAATAGLAFASVSTSDFAAHLDRQVHGLHCSFLPGLAATDVSGTTGCHVTLMSPYSSVMRDSVWGGVPISLPAMSVFAYLVFWSALLLLRGRERDTRAALFLVAATALPVVTSGVMGYLSLRELQAACKLCIGIYVASGLGFLGALGVLLAARSHARLAIAGEVAGTDTRPLSWVQLGLAFALGVAFVCVPFVAYAKSAPDFSRYVGKCGEIRTFAEAENVVVPLGPQGRTDAMVEVLDPLCPACKAFEARYLAMPIAATISRKALLFPLDHECNWMVDSAIHPGACAISEAVLCAKNDAADVLEWAFAEQEAIMAAARKDPTAAARMVKARFPEVGECVGSPAVRARLNLGLRWAVKNRLQVLTPQVYVGGLRLCDEDTDLGLDYALPRLIERGRGKGGRAK